MELAVYKQNRINELINIYNLGVLRLNTYLASSIRAIQSSRSRTKQAQINSLVAKYNADIAALKVKLNTEINKVNAFNPIITNASLRKRALLIGCNYINTPYSLSGCIDDAERVKNMLTQRGFNNFQLLTDLTSVKPTKANILSEFRQLLINSKAGDVLFFYFSGHGSYTIDTNGDETDGKDEMIISTDLQGVLDDELRSIITSSMKDGVLLIGLFDSCHSGTMMDLKYNYLDSNNYDKYTENSNIGDCKGDIIMISGCMDAQTSAEAIIQNKFQGALTWAFLDTLQKTPDCSWRDLIKSMRDNLKTTGFSQIPQISSGSFENIDAQIIL